MIFWRWNLVDSNEKWGRSERWLWLAFSLGLWRSMAICHLNMQFLFKIHISVSACYSQINRRHLDEEARRDKMFLSAITPPMGNARWTPQKIRKFSKVWIFILQIWSASPIQEINYGSANTNGLRMFVHRKQIEEMKWSKNDKTSPINLAVTIGNGNKEFYSIGNRHVQIEYNPWSPQWRLNLAL